MDHGGDSGQAMRYGALQCNATCIPCQQALPAEEPDHGNPDIMDQWLTRILATG